MDSKRDLSVWRKRCESKSGTLKKMKVLAGRRETERRKDNV